jgi:hypothetical protein
MIEPLGVFRMQTGPVLESTIDYECYFPHSIAFSGKLPTSSPFPCNCSVLPPSCLIL